MFELSIRKRIGQANRGEWMRVSRRAFVKDSVWGGVAAAALTVAANQGTAVSPSPQANRLRFGANYVPRKHWWYCWQDWDQQAVREDLTAVGDLGLDHIRIQCL
jgi:hypothetical protein